MKQVKEFGLLIDGSMNQIKAAGTLVEIREEDEYFGTYSIKWLECYTNNHLVSRYNAAFVAYIDYGEGGE